MKRKSVFFVITILLIISAMMFSYIYPFAKSEPVSQTDVTNANTETQASDVDEIIEFKTREELEKYILLGTTSERALEKYPGLGLAKYFSLFCEGDASFTQADTEGRIAAGGGVYSLAGYSYQAAIYDKDKNNADIIVGDGPVSKMAIERSQSQYNRIVAYSSSATKMNLSDYTESQQSNFVQADLIDFDNEFARLRAYSKELAEKETTGEILDTGKASNNEYFSNYYIVGGIPTSGGGYGAAQYSQAVLVLHGDNPTENIFTIDAKEFGSNSNSYAYHMGLLFDVPYDSKVVLNIVGDSDVELDFGLNHNIFYPLTENKIAEINTTYNKIGYVTKGSVEENGVAEYLTDENGNIKPFIKVAGGNANAPSWDNLYDISEKMLFNLPDVTNIRLGDCGVSILAPNANITPVLDYNGKTEKPGYFLGNLICKSYTGRLQFGAIPTNVTRKYRFNVNKLDEKNMNLQGAEFKIFDMDNSSKEVYSWTTSNSPETIELDSGRYMLAEIKPPENYDINQDASNGIEFTIKYDGKIYDENNNMIAIADIFEVEESEEKTYIEHEQEWNRDAQEIQVISLSANDIEWQNLSNATSDGGHMTPLVFFGNNITLPPQATTSNESIEYEPKNKEWQSSAFLKQDANGKIEFITPIEFSNSNVYSRAAMELEDRYVVVGLLSEGTNVYIDGSQTKNGENIYCNCTVNGAPFIIIIDKQSKKIIDCKVSKKAYPLWILSQVHVVSDDTIYFKSSSSYSQVIKYTTKTDNFPTTWTNLYLGLDDDVGNITKVSFDIDTSNATDYVERDLHMVVAENNGRLHYELGGASNWVEFVSNTIVKDGDNITTTIPITPWFYPYTKSNIYQWADNTSIIKFQPHFYRQYKTSEDGVTSWTPTDEVTDIDVKNIKAYWKEVQTQIKQKITQLALEEEKNNTITIVNERIKTTIEITKKDRETDELLQGAVFGIYNENNELLFTSNETNEQGIAILEQIQLDVGNYYIKEITAPQGYKKSEEKTQFMITKSETLKYDILNEKTKVTIEKVDQDGNLLTGAELKIEDMDGKEIAKWTTTDSAKIVEKLTPGTYKLTESFTPHGYVKGNDIVFTVNEFGEVFVDNQKVEKLIMVNNFVKGNISITKTGEVYSSLTLKDKLSIYTNYAFNYNKGTLSGVTFELYAGENIKQGDKVIYAKDEKITETETNELGIATFENLPLGNYYAVEKQALTGYVTNKTPIVLDLVYKNDTTPIVYATNELNNERVHVAINVEKTKKGTTNKVEGAIYGLYNADELFNEISKDMLLSTVITDSEGKGTFDIDLPVGNYYVKELKSPDGYLLSDEVKEINFYETANFNLKFEDDYTKLEISKVEINTITPVVGATLQLQDTLGNVIETWVTDKEVHKIDALPAGNYIIVEKIPAPGYTTAENKQIKVSQTADVQSIKIEDDYTKLEVSKFVVNTKDFLPGATLQIFDKNNNPVLDETGKEYKWVTEENAHIINKLPIGNYILKEVETPEGYVTANDIEFTIQDKNDVHTITMYDDFTKVNISKLDIETKEKMSGAILQIFDMENKPVLDEKGNSYKWETTSESNIIYKLPIGKYKLVEIEPATGYIKADDIEFEVVDNGEVVNVVMEDDFTKLNVSKIDEYGNPVIGATLQIIEINLEGNELNAEENNEVETKNKVVHEWTTTEKPEQINKILEVGKKYELVEATAPAGFAKSENIEFYVNDLGQIMLNNQVVEEITMKDNFATGTIKITKTANVLTGVKKIDSNGEFEQLEQYQFEYEDGTLSGVIFELYAEEDIILNETTKYKKDEKIGEAITDENGIATFENINIGNYYFVEKETNASYEINKTPVSVVLAYNSENPDEQLVYTTTFNNERKHAEIKVIKLQKALENEFDVLQEEKDNKEAKDNKDDQVKLPNVVFGLYTTNELCGLPANTLLSIAKTNEVGEAIFDIDIPLGEYYVKEIQTIDGYVLSDEKQDINFTDTNNFELTFENDYTKVKIKKVNEQNELIDNAILQVQDMEGNVIDEWISKSSGGHIINAKLIAGETYKLVEIDTPEGYNKADDIEFTVNKDGTLNVIKMVDTEKLSGNMPQTGEKTNYIFVSIICIAILYGLMNFTRFAYISSKENNYKK